MMQEYTNLELQVIYSTMYGTNKCTFHPETPLGGAHSHSPH